jgi:hypothetical protein
VAVVKIEWQMAHNGVTMTGGRSHGDNRKPE